MTADEAGRENAVMSEGKSGAGAGAGAGADGEGKGANAGDGWVTAGRDRKSVDGGRPWSNNASAGDTTARTSEGERQSTRGTRGGRDRKFKDDARRAGGDSWGKRSDGRSGGADWGGKGWVDNAQAESHKAEGGDGKRAVGGARSSRDGFPTRPTGAGRGFTMGRGKSGGQALQLSLGALQVSSVSESFYERVMSKSTEGQFTDATGEDGEEGAEKKDNGAKYRYTASEMVTILRQLEESNTCVLPADVCATNVPMKNIQPGDPLWELTMIGRHGDWAKEEKKADTKASAAKDSDVPEWAQEGNALIDASMTDDSFLGTTMPELTKEEREGFFAMAASAEPAPQQTSRFVALEEEETIMPHMSHLGGIQGMMQPPVAQMPPVQMPPVRMPPVQMPPQQQQAPPQQPLPVPPNIDWLYLDPSGQQQGPFSRQELMEWHQGGFFPNDLPCRPIDAPPQAPFMPLIELLQSGWRYHIPMPQQPPPQHQHMPPMGPPPPQAGGGGLPPWLANMPQGPPVGSAPPARGMTLEELERAHRAPEPQAPPPSMNALANFAAGLGISNQQGQAPPPQVRGLTLAELEARQMHHSQGRQENAGADASSQWDAPPAQRAQPPIPQAMPIPKAMPAPMPPAQEPPPSPQAPTGPAWGGAAPAPPANVGKKTLLDIQREEEARAALAAKNAPPPSMHGAVLGSAWGGQSSAGKSLKEIQEEEARAAERRAAAAAQQQQQYQSQLPSGGWAATAAAGAAKTVPRPAMSIPTPVARAPAPAPAPQARPAMGVAVAPLTQPPATPSATSMPPLNNKNALRAWCKSQMLALNNSDDMTLVDFLLGLPSAGEVQEYVALYLGKTAQATAFAGELIRQKRADPSLAEGLGNGELAKVAASQSSGGGGGFDDGVGGDDDSEAWANASRKKKGGKR